MTELMAVSLTVIVWLAIGFRIIRENERAVKVLLGNPYAVVESGLRWTFWPFVTLIKYPTNIVELGGKSNGKKFKRAGIFTKKGKSQDPNDPEIYGPVNVGADISFRFFWPKDNNRLINVVKLLPKPDNLEALTDIFEETILEHVRTVGGQRTWVDLARDRSKFSADITASILASQAQGIIDDVDNPMVVIDHLEIPDELLNTIQKQEVARLKRAATIIDAEAEKSRLMLIGEGNESRISSEGKGVAYARKKLYEAIGREPENIQKEILLTLREMAQGTANKIFFQIPSQITDTLGEMFGKKITSNNIEEIFSSLPPNQRNMLLKKVIEWIEEKK